MIFEYNIVMGDTTLSLPKVESVIIKIKNDSSRFTDVVKIIHAKDFFNQVWEIKQLYDPSSEYPIKSAKKANEHYINTYYGIRDSKKDAKFTQLVYELRKNYGLSTHYERLIHKLIFTGVVEDGDYKKAYYTRLNKYYSDDPDDFEQVDVIVVHQGTRTEDLDKPLREFLNLYEVKTKTGKSFLPNDIKNPPDYLKPYISESQYNKYAVDAYRQIELYYPYYQLYVLENKKPQQLALKKIGISRKQLGELKKSDVHEDMVVTMKVSDLAKGISEGITRIKKLISSD
jgi:hypothetical protein